MVVIKRVGVLSLGTMWGILSAIGGLIAGLLMAGFFSVISAFAGVAGDINGGGYGMDDLGYMGWMFGGMAIIIYPVLYGVLGFLSGVIGGALYNLFVKWVGGIKVQLVQEVTVEESTTSNT